MKIFLRTITAIGFCLVFLLTFTYGQSSHVPQDPVTLHSPNVAALGMYGEVPVSYFTGVPDIEIPLYTLKEKEITLPISLSYHASGFRPDQHPWWTGNGWSLQAGGVVTRIVHNLPDDDDDVIAGTDNTGIGFFFRHSALTTPSWSNASFIENTVIGNNSLNYLLDVEPDEFDFNFAGHSGKFYMDDAGVYHAEGDKGIQISLINPQSPIIPNFFPPAQNVLNNPFINANLDSFAGFIITTTDGTQYVFGGTNTAIEYSKDFFHEGTTTWIADSWYLTKIIGPDGSQISFSYQRGPFINQLSASIYQKSTSTTALNPISWYDFWNLGPPSCSSYNNPLAGGIFTGKLISPLYLSQISSEQATINFSMSPTNELGYPANFVTGPTVYPPGLSANGCGDPNNPFCPDNFYNLYDNFTHPTVAYPQILNNLIWEELDNIQVVKNDNSQVLEKWNFSYTHDPTQRLTLLNVQEQSGTGLLIPPYRFYYDQSLPLPGYFVNQNDHWGFWNGTAAVLSFDQYGQILNGTGYFSLRQPRPAYATAGILNRIIYPTSAVTTFLFEPNTYSSAVDSTQRWNPLILDPQDRYAGGVRIKQITTTDPNFPSQQKTKQYFYINNYSPATGFTGRSSGVLGTRAQYYWPNYTIRDVASNQATNITVFSTQSVLPASENSMGSHIGYSAVIEKNADGSVTQYQYTNFDNGHMDDPFITDLQPNSTPYVSYNSKALERGKLLSQTVYSASGLPLSSLSYNYTAQTTNPIKALKANRLFTCNGGTLSYDEGVAYEFYIYPFLPTTTTTVLYDNNGLNPQTSVKNTSYEGQHNFVSQETTTDSKARLVTTTYRYPFNVLAGIPTPGSTIAQPVSYLINNNIIGTPIETTQSKVLNGNDMIISASVKTYKGINITNPLGVAAITVKPALEYYFESSQPLLRSGYTNYSTWYNANGTTEVNQIDPHLVPRADYTNYDTRGNLAQFNDNATFIATPAQYFPHYSSYLWGYNKLFPIAKVENAGNINLTTEFYAENFEESTLSGVTTGSPHTGLYYLLAPSFTVNWTPPNSRGYVISYWYKSGGLWKYSGELPYTGTSYVIANGDGAYDDIRVYPKGAHMSTYTYSRLTGLTSSIDPRGKTDYYEYDDFQRLMNIKNVNGGVVSIAKSYVYNYPASINQTASWQDDGNTKCVVDANGNNTGEQLMEQVDNNVTSATYGSKQWRSLGMNGACPVTLTFTVTNHGTSGLLASFEGGPTGNINVNLPAGTNLTAPIPIYSNYTLVISPTGSPVNRVFILGNRSPTPAEPGASFNGVNITAGSADLNLIIN